LSDFLHVFEFPEDSKTELKSIWNSFILSYFNRKIYRIGDIVLIEMEGIFEMASKFGAIFTIIGLLASVLLHWVILTSITIMLVILFLGLLSPKVRTLLYVIRIKSAGHKPKINLISYTYVLQKLLHERENVAK
jgi:hypothetical protein